MVRSGLMVAGAALLLVGCGSGEATTANAAPTQDMAAKDTGEGKAAKTAPIADKAGPTQTTDLTVYDGKYPFDEVNGVKFIDHPAVKVAIDTILKDPKNRAFIRGTSGVDVPIFVKEGRVVAAGCEHRACDTYNWTIAIAPDGKKAEICLYQGEGQKYGEEAAEDDWRNTISSMWYDADGGLPMTIGTCPANAEDYPAKDIVAG